MFTNTNTESLLTLFNAAVLHGKFAQLMELSEGEILEELECWLQVQPGIDIDNLDDEEAIEEILDQLSVIYNETPYDDRTSKRILDMIRECIAGKHEGLL